MGVAVSVGAHMPGARHPKSVNVQNLEEVQSWLAALVRQIGRAHAVNGWMVCVCEQI